MREAASALENDPLLLFGPGTRVAYSTPGHTLLAMAMERLVADDTVFRVPPFDNSDKWAGGGFVSTPSDLVRFGNAILQGPFITEEWRSVLLRRIAPERASMQYPLVSGEDGNSEDVMKLSVGGTR